MSQSTPATISVAALFAEREARRLGERQDDEQLQRRKQEEIAAFKQRLDDFQITEQAVQAVLSRVRRAFDQGETELMLTSFPSTFCTDGGRAIGNAALPPINKPDENEPPPEEPAWLATLPKGACVVYDYWKTHLKPGGFGYAARIISYPGGKPGDVGLFLTWPKSLTEA